MKKTKHPNILSRVGKLPLSLWRQYDKHIKTLHPPQKIMSESKDAN